MSSSFSWMKRTDPSEVISGLGSLGGLSNPIPLNSGELLVAKLSYKSTQFWSYNTLKFKWKLLTSTKNYISGDHRIVFDKEKQLIYFILDDQALHASIGVYDLKSNSVADTNIALPLIEPTKVLLLSLWMAKCI